MDSLPARTIETWDDGVLIETIEVYTVEEYVPLLVAYVKAWAGRILAATDWMTIKAFETGVPLDPDVVASRQAVRDVSNYIESNALAATTGAELDAIPWASMLAEHDTTIEHINPPLP